MTREYPTGYTSAREAPTPRDLGVAGRVSDEGVA